MPHSNDALHLHSTIPSVFPATRFWVKLLTDISGNRLSQVSCTPGWQANTWILVFKQINTCTELHFAYWTRLITVTVWVFTRFPDFRFRQFQSILLRNALHRSASLARQDDCQLVSQSFGAVPVLKMQNSPHTHTPACVSAVREAAKGFWLLHEQLLHMLVSWIFGLWKLQINTCSNVSVT